MVPKSFLSTLKPLPENNSSKLGLDGLVLERRAGVLGAHGCVLQSPLEHRLLGHLLKIGLPGRESAALEGIAELLGVLSHVFHAHDLKAMCDVKNKSVYGLVLLNR